MPLNSSVVQFSNFSSVFVHNLLLQRVKKKKPTPKTSSVLLGVTRQETLTVVRCLKSSYIYLYIKKGVHKLFNNVQ